MNTLSHSKLVREVLALAREAYGWDAEVKTHLARGGGSDRFRRDYYDVCVSVRVRGQLMFSGPWCLVKPNGARRRLRPPMERALREVIAWLKDYLRIRLAPAERQEILERLAADRARRLG